MISEKANDLLNDFGGKQFDFASGLRRGDAGDAARVEARNKLASYIAALEAENAELREGRTLYDTYMSDEAMSLIIASKQALEAEVAALKEERRWIPVREQMPTSGTQLVLLKNKKMDFDFTYIDGGRYYWWRNGNNVTHWMPLPEPPIVYGKEREE